MSLAYPCLLGDATIKFEHFWWVIAEAAKPSILPFNYLTYHHHHKNSSNKQKLPAHIPITLFHAASAGYSALCSLCLCPLYRVGRSKHPGTCQTAVALKHTGTADREGSGDTPGLLLWLWEGKREWVTGSLPCYEQRMTDTLQTGFIKRSDSECLRSCFVIVCWEHGTAFTVKYRGTSPLQCDFNVSAPSTNTTLPKRKKPFTWSLFYLRPQEEAITWSLFYLRPWIHVYMGLSPSLGWWPQPIMSYFWEESNRFSYFPKWVLYKGITH